MKLVVGLGNPGKQYEVTRHNIGFMIIDMVCQKLQIDINKIKFNGQYVKTIVNNQDTIFLKPLTYMNLSGVCINNFIQYFKIDVKDVLIIHDEVDLPFAQIQYKSNFSAAGHNGIKNIFKQTNNTTWQRLRFGIGKNPNFDTANWVLNNFTNDELKIINTKQDFIVTSVISWINSTNFAEVMNKYNKNSFIKN